MLLCRTCTLVPDCFRQQHTRAHGSLKGVRMTDGPLMKPYKLESSKQVNGVQCLHDVACHDANLRHVATCKRCAHANAAYLHDGAEDICGCLHLIWPNNQHYFCRRLCPHCPLLIAEPAESQARTALPQAS